MTPLEDQVRRTLRPALPEADVQECLHLVWDALTHAVGRRLVDKLTDTEMTELERITGMKGDAAARRWLDGPCPDHSRVLEEETTGILAQLARIHV